MSLDKLKPSQIAIIEKTLQDRARVVREQVNQWLKELREIEDAIDNLCNGKGKTHTIPVLDETTVAIIKVHRDLGNKYLKPIQIRDQYKLNTGKEMSQSTLRNYHRKYKGTIFEMKGKGRKAEWRLIREDKEEETSMN